MHPGRTAELFVTTDADDVSSATPASCCPPSRARPTCPRVVGVAELDLDRCHRRWRPQIVADRRSAPCPAATQDLSLVVDAAVPAGDVLAAVREGAGALLEQHRPRRRLPRRGRRRPARKSLTFALRFRAPDRTLTAAEASEAKLAGVAVAAARFGATLRE